MSVETPSGTGTTQAGTQQTSAGTAPAGTQQPGTGTTQAGTQQTSAGTAPAGTQTDKSGDLLDGAAGTTSDSSATAPEIEIKVPDGVEIDKEMLAGFKELAKGLKMDSPGAQRVVDFYLKAQAAAVDAQTKAWTAQTAKWREEVQGDKEVGGAALQTHLTHAKAALAKFGPEFAAAIKELGIGNHPALIKFAARVGKAMTEDTILGTGGGPVKVSDEEAALRAAFPSMYKTERKD